MKRLVAVMLLLLMLTSFASATTVIPDDAQYHWWAIGTTWDTKPLDYNEETTPYWIEGEDGKLFIPNSARPMVKTVWLEITFKDHDAIGPGYLVPTFGIEVPSTSTVVGGTGSMATPVPGTDNMLYWSWVIDPQPEWEILDLGNSPWSLTDVGGTNAIQRIDVASKCVPEPSCLVLLLGATLLIFRRR